MIKLTADLNEEAEEEELPLSSEMSTDESAIEDGAKKLKRIRSRRKVGPCASVDPLLKEKIFLRDLHFGFLPDNAETDFAECLDKVKTDARFASMCFKLALRSRNEDLLKALLERLDVARVNFVAVNATFVDPLLLEAVELDDLESIQAILAWRDAKAVQISLGDVEKKLLKLQKKAQEVIVAAAVKNNYSIIKLLYNDGYKILTGPTDEHHNYTFDKSDEIFDLHAGNDDEEEVGDLMESSIERIRRFRAVASPAYMAMTYTKDPVEHAFDFAQQARLGLAIEPEFRSEYEIARKRCSEFAVAILDSCRNSYEVELVLNGPGSSVGRDQPYARLYRALYEDQKEFVSHPYCQVLLHSKWLKGLKWPAKNRVSKLLHIFTIILIAPVMAPFYILSPFRDHAKVNNVFGRLLAPFDVPINRFILDMASYAIFLVCLFISVHHRVHDRIFLTEKELLFEVITKIGSLWILASSVRLVSQLVQVAVGRITLNKFRFFFDLVTNALFLIATGFKLHGRALKQDEVGGGVGDRLLTTDTWHPINIGANVYGVAACMAFLRVIFHFEIHSRFGPILFGIKKVVWDIISIVGSFFIALFAFGVGLVSVYGIYADKVDNKFENFSAAFKTLFWIIFDPGKEEYADISFSDDEKECGCSSNNGSSTLKPPPTILARPALPDPSEYANFAAFRPQLDTDDLSHIVGLIIWGFYQVFVVLIMLNLLISLMTSTFSRIQQNADTEWKFTRASTWIYYFDDLNSMPMPLNLIPSVYSIRKMMSFCCGNRCLTRDKNVTWTSSLV